MTLAALLGMASFAGCGKRAPTEPVPGPPPPSPAPSDTAAIDAAIAQSGLDADGLFPLGEVSLGDGAQLTTSAAVTTLAFRRTIPRSDYANTYEFSNPDTAGKPRRVVSLRCKYQKGKLQLVHQLAPQDPTPGDSSARLVDKVMNADWMRTIELRRDVPTGGWRVTAASEVFLLVDDHRTCADCHAWIEEVRLQSGTVDVTLRDNDLTLDSLIHLGADAPATVTARSRNDVHVVLLHDASGSHVLPRVAPNHFSGAMAVGAAGLRHLTVEALSDSSLFDDRAPVSQHGWTFHYVVNP
ncbi:MAG: hypothetical protein ACRENJ_05875 [Candidatus Eiseniibacteriota bacterium]